METVINMIEVQAAHRQKLEINLQNIQIKQVESDIEDQRARNRETKNGQLFALSISILGILCAFGIAYLGYPGAASIVSLTGLTGLAGKFIKGRKR